jgi:hypothetical protein
MRGQLTTTPNNVAYASDEMSVSRCDKTIQPTAPATVSASPDTVPQKKALHLLPAKWRGRCGGCGGGGGVCEDDRTHREMDKRDASSTELLVQTKPTEKHKQVQLSQHGWGL